MSTSTPTHEAYQAILLKLQNARLVWGPYSQQYAACAEIAVSYGREMKLELGLGAEPSFGPGSGFVGSIDGEDKERLAGGMNSEVECIPQGRIEEAFGKLDIGKREGARR